MPVVYLTEELTNRRGQRLAGHYWYPATGVKIKGVVFLSHGFSEHLGLYCEVGEFLSERGYLAFGHDHMGHGSSEGKRAYIESVDQYVDDVIEHCMMVKEKNPGMGLFLVGHSMGGMISLSCVLRHPSFFQGLVLNGPLIVPGPQVAGMDLRATPLRTLVSKSVLQLLSLVIPEVALGGPNLDLITRDKDMQDILVQDKLRWTGGCKVMLLLAFVICMDDNINQLTEVRIPFLTLHGENDRLCNPVGSELLYKRSPSEDKAMKTFPGACHQLFMEYPVVKREVFFDIVQWLDRRI